jgi:NitT/TauT family transport system substrate-binding protein
MNSPLMPPALVNGEVDYAAALGNVLWAAMQGVPIKGIMVLQSRPTLSLVARPEIASGKDLKDKAIAVSSRGALTDHIAREAARHFGLDPDRDITTLGVGDQSQRILAMQSGRVAAAVLDPPVEFKALAMGFKLLIRGADFMEDPQIGLVASDRKIKEKPDEVRRMVRATLKGLHYARTHKAETVAAIERTFKIDRDAAEQSYNVVIPLLSADALPTKRSLESLPQTFKTFTKQEPKLTPAQAFDLSFLKEVLPGLELR